MRKNRITPPAKKATEYDVPLPDWYWKRGLHDAVIRSVRESELVPDWKERHPKRNCLTIELDSKNALFETNIRRISLYNHRIEEMKRNAAEPVALEAFTEVYWLGDSIRQLENGRYLLEIECTDPRGDRLNLTVKFELPEIERS